MIRTWKGSAPVVQAFLEAFEESLRGFVEGCRWLPLVHDLPRWLRESQERRAGVPRSLLLYSPFAWDFLWSEQNAAVARVHQITVPGQSRCDSSNFPLKAGPVDLVGRVLQVHGPKASYFVVAVAGVDTGLTAVWNPPAPTATDGGSVSCPWSP